MKTVLLGTVALVALAAASSASAADLPARMYTKAPVSPAYDWSGYYVGVFGGGAFSNHNLSSAAGTANYGDTGGLVGGDVGYNWQSGNTVLGVEGDVAWFGVKSNDSFALGPNDETSLRWAATVRARAGFAVDRFLLFFTGGWAYGDQKHVNTDPVLGGVDRFTFDNSGWTAGGGLEYALTPNLTSKVEYRYYSFGNFSRGGSITPNGQLPYTVDSTYSTVTVGLNYKFGEPVAARY
jgi:outer membrane immunogenic protein